MADIFALAAYAREHDDTPEYDAFLVKTYNEAQQHDILKDYDPKSWWFERLKYIDPTIFNKSEWKEGHVRIDEIVGTTHNVVHEMYAGHTWLYMLVGLKKSEKLNVHPPKNKDEAEEATEPSNMTDVYLYKLDGKYYVDEGNHRITYAKIIGDLNVIKCQYIELKHK